MRIRLWYRNIGNLKAFRVCSPRVGAVLSPSTFTVWGTSKHVSLWIYRLKYYIANAQARKTILVSAWNKQVANPATRAYRLEILPHSDPYTHLSQFLPAYPPLIHLSPPLRVALYLRAAIPNTLPIKHVFLYWSKQLQSADAIRTYGDQPGTLLSKLFWDWTIDFAAPFRHSLLLPKHWPYFSVPGALLNFVHPLPSKKEVMKSWLKPKHWNL